MKCFPSYFEHIENAQDIFTRTSTKLAIICALLLTAASVPYLICCNDPSNRLLSSLQKMPVALRLRNWRSLLPLPPPWAFLWDYSAFNLSSFDSRTRAQGSYFQVIGEYCPLRYPHTIYCRPSSSAPSHRPLLLSPPPSSQVINLVGIFGSWPSRTQTSCIGH